jgi:hypothetical protein
MRILNSIFIVLFISSALLQYNDPDPYIWIPVYLLGAFICFMALRSKFQPWLYILAWIIYIPFATYLFFRDNAIMTWLKENKPEDIVQSMKATRPWIEETREFLGLIILIIALLINWVWVRKKPGNHKQLIHSGNQVTTSNANS